MKIVIDARTLGSKPSGVGIYTFNYIKELIKTSLHIILLTDIAGSEEMAFLEAAHIEIRQFGVSTYRSVQVLGYFGFVKKQLREIQPEYFWEPNFLIPRRLSGYKGDVMITIHDMFPVTHRQFFRWKYRWYFKVMLKKTLGYTDIILYDSRETKKAAERFYPEARKKRNYVQYVMLPWRDQEGGEDRGDDRVLKETGGKEYFLYVGNMEKRKGVDILLEAYEKYRKEGGTIPLVLAGKRREADIDKRIQRLVDRYREVTYYGYVSDKDKQALYEGCTCFLFPSMAEGFGICVLEAMNYYKPIIASDLSIFKEIAGECLQYFPLQGGRDRQIHQMSQKMFQFRREIDKKAYDQVMERYDPERLGRELAEILGSTGCRE